MNSTIASKSANSCDADVIIVGAGPVGLSAAIDLGRRGHNVLVLERRRSPSKQPRAHVVNARTMEIFRGWGISDSITKASLDPSLARSFGWLTKMSADELAKLDYIDDETAERTSPERLRSCPQDEIERVLLRELQKIDTVEVRFGVSVTAVEIKTPNGSVGATVTVSAEHGEETLTSRFALGADGAKSSVGTMIGSWKDRSEALARRVNIYFHEDLTSITRSRPFILWFILSLETSGIFISLNGRDRWVYSVEVGPEVDLEETFTREYATAVIRLATGVPTLEPEIQSILPWRVDMAIADRWRAGPVFLMGDAAHQFPPMGGFGMNSGIQDAHNLAWKIDAVLRGNADDALLESYEAERKAVALLNANQSMQNAVNQQEAAAMLVDPEFLSQLQDPDGAEIRASFAEVVQQQKEEFHSQGQQFGFVYSGTGVIDDGTSPEESTIAKYVVTTHPGARAPHLRLQDTFGMQLSIIDLFGQGWTLISQNPKWMAASESSSLEMPLATYLITEPKNVLGESKVSGLPRGKRLFDVDKKWDEVYRIGRDGAVLVRPDGHIAARWMELAEELDHAVGRAMAGILRPIRNS